MKRATRELTLRRELINIEMVTEKEKKCIDVIKQEKWTWDHIKKKG